MPSYIPPATTVMGLPALVRERTEFERLIPPLVGSVQVTPTVTANVTMELIDSGYKMDVEVTTPTGYTEYYGDLNPHYCFVYTVSAEGADEFIQVMTLGGMESISSESSGVAGEKYRSNVYVKVFADVQELQVARDIILDSLFALYTNVATINRATSAMKDSSVVIPTDINKSLDAIIVKLLDSKAAYLQTKALVLAYKAEIDAFGKIRIRVKTAEDQLKLVNVALNEIGTPDQLAQSQAFYKTFGETLDRLDAAYQGNDYIMAKTTSASVAAETTVSNSVATVTTQRTDLREPGEDLLAELTAGTDEHTLAQTYISSVGSSLNAIQAALGYSYVELTNIVRVDIPNIESNMLTPAVTSMRSQYEADKDKAARGITGVQTMLAQIVPMIKVLADIVVSTSSSSRAIQASIEVAQTRLVQAEADAVNYSNAITAYTTQIQHYAPNFNPEQPFYRWVVNIEVVASTTRGDS